MDENIKTGVENQEDTTTEQNKKTYTQEEVDALLQKEADRRVSEALKKVNKKNELAIKEAQKLAAMNEQEKYEYELKQREEAIIAKERELALSENKNEASKILAEKGLSLNLVDFVVAEDADTMKKNIDLLDKAFKASVRSEIEKRIGTNPKRGVSTEKTITKEDFKKMSLGDLNNLYKTNPELYKQLNEM